ncbi:hypothetical protein HanRHA438_Chr05g0239231 [Helianthus annuus]|nr:hypothetical protein HanRHA438_Chr05g0239231 [Helianthus annuus]
MIDGDDSRSMVATGDVNGRFKWDSEQRMHSCCDSKSGEDLKLETANRWDPKRMGHKI